MGQEERLAALVAELASDVGYATGERRFAGKVTGDDAADIAEALASEFDGGCELREQFAARNNVRFACGRACSGCCETVVIVSLPEALAVARWLLRAENLAARDRFLARFAQWRAAIGDFPERLAALSHRNADRAAYVEAHLAARRTRTLCAFNVDGDCLVYPVRPLVCREANAVGTADRCRGDAPGDQLPIRIQFPPVDEALRQYNALLQATHNALGAPTSYFESLCLLVHHVLTAQA